MDLRERDGHISPSRVGICKSNCSQLEDAQEWIRGQQLWRVETSVSCGFSSASFWLTRSSFVLDIIQFIPTPCIEILDLGSGIGNLSWDLGSRIRPKRSIGIEVRADLVALGRDYSSLVESQFAKFGLIPPTVLLLEGDFGVHLEVQKMVKDTATLILANNFSFDADQNDTGLL